MKEIFFKYLYFLLLKKLFLINICYLWNMYFLNIYNVFRIVLNYVRYASGLDNVVFMGRNLSLGL